MPLLPRVAGRPLLQSTRPATLTDLCGFFVTVNAAVTDSGGTVAAAAAAAAPSQHTDARLTPVSSHSQTLPRARSAPNVSLSEPQSSVWPPELKDDSALTPMEYIEKLVLTDFLEPMPQN